jgi:hypothetical protein
MNAKVNNWKLVTVWEILNLKPEPHRVTAPGSIKMMRYRLRKTGNMSDLNAVGFRDRTQLAWVVT